ncbi:type IV pilin protein [Thalassotalea sp. ND16A]|uniref:type IV pilin protein n=1 Tax=Thalassotalea sp. ND16A TaxID=1535422 RepID=UPI00051A3DEA|nr:type IV pilin protein [Thalassotalea sp. ND16A]KGJ88261.1 hypothetical protein ND16A_0201 [Thalassotalea sp. ND16A]
MQRKCDEINKVAYRVPNNSHLGFTLLELMICLVIIGILSSIAYANFQDYVRKVRRSDATTKLMHLAVLEENFYNQNMQYSNDISAVSGLNHKSLLTDDEFYQLSVIVKTHANDGVDSFILKATARASQSKDTACFSFSLSNLNEKSALNSQGVSNNNCWY